MSTLFPVVLACFNDQTKGFGVSSGSCDGDAADDKAVVGGAARNSFVFRQAENGMREAPSWNTDVSGRRQRRRPSRCAEVLHQDCLFSFRRLSRDILRSIAVPCSLARASLQCETVAPT